MSCSPGITGLDEWMGVFSSSVRAVAHRFRERIVSQSRLYGLQSHPPRPCGRDWRTVRRPLSRGVFRMIPFSVLDLSPVIRGATPGDALRNSRDLAIHAEALGFHRYWLAEHHNMTGIASAATSIVIGYVAEATKTIRVGSGGIMLPNHAPLVIAEQFGTLASLYPGRIDLGLGRAPGTDQGTARALRRALGPSDD